MFRYRFFIIINKKIVYFLKKLYTIAINDWKYEICALFCSRNKKAMI